MSYYFDDTADITHYFTCKVNPTMMLSTYGGSMHDLYNYTPAVVPRQIKYIKKGSSVQTDIYSIFLREANTGNDLSLIWRRPTTDSIVLFESETPGNYEVELKNSGFYRITICGGGGGGANSSSSGGSSSNNRRKSYMGGSSGGVFGIIFIDLSQTASGNSTGSASSDGSTTTDASEDGSATAETGTAAQSNKLLIQVGAGANSDYVNESGPDSTSYIKGILSCTGGASGQKGFAGTGGTILWDNDASTQTSGPDIPLLYDTYMWPTVIVTEGDAGTASSQGHSKGKKLTEDNYDEIAAGGAGPFEGAKIPPKSNGRSFRNGAGASLDAELDKKVSFTAKTESAGRNGYVRIEYIYDEEMIR